MLARAGPRHRQGAAGRDVGARGDPRAKGGNMPTPLTPILVAKNKNDIVLYPQMANRHGLIAGATGTGKTVTLRVLAEQFSSLGVPVFMADVKGDLSGIARAGGDHPKVAERVKSLGLDGFQYQGYPAVFWDVFGGKGHPIRA